MRRPPLWEGTKVSSIIWKGYLLYSDAAFTLIQSPFTHDGERVFGADSDATTLAVAALQHRLNQQPITSVTVPDGIDSPTLSSATGIKVADETTFDDCEWDLLLSDEATVVLVQRGTEVELPQFDVDIPVDSDFFSALEGAWIEELQASNVSQGAYISMAQYEEAAGPRLGLLGQKFAQGMTWPPRQMDGDQPAGVEHIALEHVGHVQSWTRLSAAGAPSEFSIRAPLLGGISTVLLRLNDGPSGVFLVVDDEEPEISMDLEMELVVRRIYAQEGIIRYGLKARAI